MANKYRAKKTTVDGIIFDSKSESARYADLIILQKAGLIHDLRRQVVFELAPSVIILGRRRPPLRYVSDFCYIQKGQNIVEDVKGVITDGYRIKRHLMKHLFLIDILETNNKSGRRSKNG